MPNLDKAFNKALAIIEADIKKCEDENEIILLNKIKGKMSELFKKSNMEEVPKMEDVLNALIMENIKNPNSLVAEVNESEDGEPVILMKPAPAPKNENVKVEEVKEE